MIYTSYFANWRNLKGKRLISIARYTPKWIKVDYIALELAPPLDLLRNYKNGMINEYAYMDIYQRDVLNKLDPYLVYGMYNESILLCYEKPNKFCHRFLVADWLKREIGEKVPEIGLEEL